MISMKKTALAAAVLMSVGTGVAQAAHVPPSGGPVVNFSYAGTFTMYSPSGGITGGDPAVTGIMDMDMGNGTGHASVAPSVTFFGYWWTAHNITMTATGPGTVKAIMLFDWGATTNITVTVDFSMTPNAPCSGGMDCFDVGDSFTIATLDGNGDGIPGYPMDNGPFMGFNASFGGTATVVPVPAAVWLLGSGLLGLVGVARRKKSA